MSGDPNPAIALDALTKRFGGVDVLRGIDLSVAQGQVFGYIGPNGAGKTTTVKILVGMLGGFEGHARVAGIDVRADPLAVKRLIGYLPENAQLYEALTVLEYMLLVGRLHDLDDDLIVARAEEMLTAFDVGERLHTRCGSLSKGMRQKVMFASAILHDPDVLFLDEPLSGLDVHSTVIVKDLIGALAARGKTIFYCSHMMDIVERVCDRIAIIDRGSIVAEGSFSELAAASAQSGTLEGIFLDLTRGAAADQRAAQILAALDGGTPPDA